MSLKYDFSNIACRSTAGLLLIDVQEKLFPLVENPCQVRKTIEFMIRLAQKLDLEINVVEQYPQGLGRTIEPIRQLLGEKQEYLSKQSFSALKDPSSKDVLLKKPILQWIVMGIEAHVCVSQTVRDLLIHEQRVIVLNDAISSRSIFDYSTSLAEMRDMGARVSSAESICFELLQSSQAKEFKEISELVKSLDKQLAQC